MSTYLYHNSQMEQELHSKIDAAANERHGGAVPADVQERIAAEKQHIFGSGHGTLLAVAAKLAEFSEGRGCPVGLVGQAVCGNADPPHQKIPVDNAVIEFQNGMHDLIRRGGRRIQVCGSVCVLWDFPPVAVCCDRTFVAACVPGT